MWSQPIAGGLPVTLRIWASTQYQNYCQIPESTYMQQNWKRAGPLARLSLSSVSLVDKGQEPRSGIGPLLLLFSQLN